MCALAVPPCVCYGYGMVTKVDMMNTTRVYIQETEAVQGFASTQSILGIQGIAQSILCCTCNMLKVLSIDTAHYAVISQQTRQQTRF